MSTVPSLAVVTWFHDDQVGYRDFLYRLHALSPRFRMTILSRRPLEEPELALAQTPVVVLPPRRPGVKGLVEYWWRVARWLSVNPVDGVLHLGSHTAAVAAFSHRAPHAIYWNEHLTHYLATARSFSASAVAMWALRALQYRGARSAAVVMPIGLGQQRDLLAQGCDPKRVRWLPMGVAHDFEDASRSSCVASSGRTLRVIYAGSIHPDRGRDLFIDALALARQRGLSVHLTLVGASASQQQWCRDRAEALGIGDELNVLPRLPGEQIPALLKEADFGLCAWIASPHYRLNPPTKLFEYLVAGLPVMASRIESHVEHVQDGVNGLIFDYHPESLVDAFARAIDLAPSWPTLRQQAQASGAIYRWENIEPRFLDAIGSMLAR